MRPIKIVLLGNEGSGKTALINQMVHGVPFDESYERVGLPDFASKLDQDNILMIYGINTTFSKVIYHNAVIFAYCIDLSEDIPALPQLEQGNSPEICVLFGMKADKCLNQDEAQAKFTALRQQLAERDIVFDDDKCVLTSAKTSMQIKESLDLLARLANVGFKQRKQRKIARLRLDLSNFDALIGPEPYEGQSPLESLPKLTHADNSSDLVLSDDSDFSEEDEQELESAEQLLAEEESKRFASEKVLSWLNTVEKPKQVLFTFTKPSSNPSSVTNRMEQVARSQRLFKPCQPDNNSGHVDTKTLNL